MTTQSSVQPTPVILLKTISTPTDAYETYFTSSKPSRAYDPVFIPVLTHRYSDLAINNLTTTIHNGAFTQSLQPTTTQVQSRKPDKTYGGIIFTSQRAVEAFTTAISSLRQQSLDLSTVFRPATPLYVVGPATANALRALALPNVEIIGEETGNGEALAHFIMDDYSRRYPSDNERPGLLFLVGEKRRDIIPRTLDDEQLPPSERIGVDEWVVYESVERPELAQDLREMLRSVSDAEKAKETWVVVFSPTGCKVLLEELETMRQNPTQGKDGGRKVRIATIGPTTRDFLAREFGVEPDVCAEKPSPEGVGEGIEEFLRRGDE